MRIAAPWPVKPVHVKTRTFCFCVPVRVGTCVLALVSATASVALCVDTVTRMSSGVASWIQGWAGIAAIVLWASLALISMFGFTGAWYKNRRNVEYFYELCWFHLWFDVIIGIFYLVSLAWGNSRIKMIEVCLDAIELTYPTLKAFKLNEFAMIKLFDKCASNTKLTLILLDLCWAIALLVELWLVLIIGHTLDELEDWDAAAEGFDLEGDVPYKFIVDSSGQQRIIGRSGKKKSKSSSKQSSSRRASEVYAPV